MFFAESEWVIDALQPIVGHLTTAIDVGAGNAKYRGRAQNRRVHGFLRERNVQLTTLDVNGSCDLCADVTDVRTMPASIAPFDLVLCTSVLEHVTDVYAAAGTLRRLTAAGGYLLITVPRSYPPHRSPIDTGYRPTNREIETLFPGLAVPRSEIICPPRDKWFHWLIFPPGLSIPRVSCVLLRNGAGPA
jgi:SAM-dependent methyltransferase